MFVRLGSRTMSAPHNARALMTGIISAQPNDMDRWQHGDRNTRDLTKEENRPGSNLRPISRVGYAIAATGRNLVSKAKRCACVEDIPRRRSLSDSCIASCWEERHQLARQRTAFELLSFIFLHWK
jgi:hypothetical protein